MKKDLEAAGFAVEQVLSEIGSIIGRAEGAAVKKARSVKGVADVSPGGTVDIGPPGSDETW